MEKNWKKIPKGSTFLRETRASWTACDIRGKMDFFPSWTRSSFFAQDSTDWEPAAIEKRNPRIRSINSELSNCDKDELMDRGGWRGQEEGADWIRRKNIFALATDFFFKIGRSKYLQNRVLTGGTVFSLIWKAGCTTAITVKRQWEERIFDQRNVRWY